MAERKAVNKYYPPNWDPSKGSLNKFHGQHPLRDRARKLKQGIMIVRFEMPFNIWCEGCKAHIGKGVRYNSEKKQIGMYYSTKIFSFRMKCHLCPNWIEIHTDPKNTDYIVAAGGRKKIETWEDGEENGTIKLIDEEERKKLDENPFYKLENAKLDETRALEVAPSLEKLQDFRNSRQDDYSLSRMLRKNFRVIEDCRSCSPPKEQKKKTEMLRKEGQKKGLSLALLPSSEEDKLGAQSVTFRRTHDLEMQERKRKMAIRSSSIFGNGSNEAKRRATINTLLQRKS